MSDNKLVVHHLNNSRSQRILWLLEELEVPYEVKLYKRDENKRAPSELLKIHPLGKSPVITDGDVTLAESGAIIQYIVNKYGNGRAAPPKEGEVIDLYFTHFAEGSFMPPLVNKYVFSMAPAKAPFFIRPLVRAVLSALDAPLVMEPLKRNLQYIEDTLEKSPTGWFAGGTDPTMADYMMSFGLEKIAESAPDLIGPKTKGWVERVQERPAYKRTTMKYEKPN